MCLYPLIVKNYKLDTYFDIALKNKIDLDLFRDVPRFFEVPCGKCIECQKQLANVWSVRNYLESLQHTESISVTLTYRNSPDNLVKRDIQLFFKRLRKKGYKFRYFGCGEYGGRGGRPHYHLCLYGYSPKDMTFFKYSKKGHNPLYKSKEIENTWGLGFCLCEKLTVDSARYASLYLQKFNDLETKKVKPFRLMSRKPGIGLLNIEKSYDKIYETDKIYYNGLYISTPRIILDRLLKSGYDLDLIKEKRKCNSVIYKKKKSETLFEDRKNFENFL